MKLLNKSRTRGEPAESPRVDSRLRLSQRRSAGADEGYEGRTDIPEKKQKGRRHWQGKGEQQQVV